MSLFVWCFEENERKKIENMEFPYLEEKDFFFSNIDISFEFSRFFFFSFIAKNLLIFLLHLSHRYGKYRNRRFVVLLLWL